MDIEPHSSYIHTWRNRQFVRLVNIVHYALNEGNTSVEILWKYAKRFRFDDLKAGGCYNPDLDMETTFIEKMESKFNISIGFDIGDYYYVEYYYDFFVEYEKLVGLINSQVTEKTLYQSAKLFVYLANCRKGNKQAWKNLYSDLFRDNPPRIIIQALAVLSKHKIHTGGRGTRNIPSDLINIPSSLFSRLHKFISFEYEKINFATQTLKSDQLTTIGTELQKCMKEAKCDLINEIFRSIGGLLLPYRYEEKNLS